MGRKRRLKKEQSRAGALDLQLQDLYRKGADEELLQRVQARGHDLSLPPFYGEVVDRAVRRALAGADFKRLGQLLARIRREARARPLVQLAEGAWHLGEGRLGEAQTALAAIGPAADGGPVPPGLVDALAALASVPDAGGDAVAVPPLRDLFRALSRFEERGFRPKARDLETLRQALAACRDLLAADPAAKRLLETAQESVRLLAALDAVERALKPRGKAKAVRDPGRLFQTRATPLFRPLQEIFRAGPPAAVLLRPLYHALRSRWRDVLELLGKQGGAAVWAEVETAAPALFALDFEGGSGADRRAGWAAVRRLQAGSRPRDLARFLESQSRTEKAPDRLALLWSLELRAWREAGSAESDSGDRPETDFGEPAGHVALVRLVRMAAEVAQRIPADQRPEVSRFLRARLLDLCQAVYFCDHVLDAAGNLVHHLDDDAVLLALAVSAAVCAGDVRARDLFAARAAARPPAHAAERQDLLEVVAELAKEKVEHVAQALPRLRPLLGEEAWPEAAALAARGLAEAVASCLLGRWDQTALRRAGAELDRCRAVLAGCAEFEALDAVLDSVRQGRNGPRILQRFLARSSALEAAATALRLLRTAANPWAPKEVEVLLREARAAVVARLDRRWRIWMPLLPSLVLGVERKEIRRLRERLLQLLGEKDLPDADRTAIERAVGEVDHLQQVERGFWRSVGRTPRGRTGPRAGGGGRRAEPRKRKPARPQTEEAQLDFEFF